MPTADGLDTNESTVGRTSGNRGARGHGGLSRSAIVLQRRGESQNFLSFSFWKENDRIKSGLRPSSETDRQGVDLCLARSCYGACRRERAVPERFGGKSTTLNTLVTLPRFADDTGSGQDAEEPGCCEQAPPPRATLCGGRARDRR